MTRPTARAISAGAAKSWEIWMSASDVVLFRAPAYCLSHILRRQRRVHARRHAVVLGHDGVDLGQAPLHVLLGVVWIPFVGEGLADVLDRTGVDERLQGLHHAAVEEGRARIVGIALEDGFVRRPALLPLCASRHGDFLSFASAYPPQVVARKARP